jgi:hypothetical protein
MELQCKDLAMNRLAAKLSKAIFCGFVLLLGLTSTVSAQSPSSNSNSIVSFVQSIAQTVYKAAWPTATYKAFTIDSIHPAPSGLDIGVKLSGLSHWDGSDLWVTLVIEVRNGAYHGVRVQDHNGLVPPFFTTGTLAEAAAQMTKAYAAQHAQPAAPPVVTPAPAGTAKTTAQWAAAVCLANTTSGDLAFDYKWGNSAWQQAKVSSGHQLAIWWPYADGPRTSPQLSIRYDDSFADGYTERDYDLDRTQAALPVSCDSATNYKFAMNGSTILLYSTGAQ